MTRLCFLDTETDGVHPSRRPWEIAIIRRDDNAADEQSHYVDIDLSTADPFGLRVGRFYERHPYGTWLSGRSWDDEEVGCLSPDQAARWVAQMTYGAHLVGAVPNFDAEVLDKLLRAHGLLPAWHYHLIDVEALAVGYLAAKRVDYPGSMAADVSLLPWSSEDLSRACGVEPPSEEERHTALGDARWAMRLYDAIVGDREAS